MPMETTWFVLFFAVVFFLSGVKLVRPTHRGVVERLGKYNRFMAPGFNWVFPVIENVYLVNITEQLVEANPQEIITYDNLNARVDAQVYFKIRPDEINVKNSLYNVQSCQYQIVNLARTTLRNIIGTMTLKSANSERGKINVELLNVLLRETKEWGIEIVLSERIAETKHNRQLVFVSHNANIVVNGDAELVVCFGYQDAADNTRGKIDPIGSIDCRPVRDAITAVMEGGRHAFELRQQKYGF